MLGHFPALYSTSGLVKIREAIFYVPVITQSIRHVSGKVNASSLNLRP